MLVKELQQLLSKCHPDSTVLVIADKDQEPDNLVMVDQDFEVNGPDLPAVVQLWTQSAAEYE